jgi:lauroyl/myristoyl acyltransferase
MRLIDAFNTRLAIGLGLFASSITPPWIGYPLARAIAHSVAARRRSTMVRAVRSNQWILHNERISSRDLDRAVLRVFQNTGRGLYEFFHFLDHPDAFRRVVEFDASFEAAFDRAKRSTRGTIWVAPHVAGFDVIGRAMVLHGMPMQFLTYPSPPGGYRWQNEMRELPGALITPMSIGALRQASETLRGGGTVITAVDRPLPKAEAKYRPRFFEHAAILPVFHVRLARRHDLPITVVGARRGEDGHYHVWASDPIPMERRPDLVEETVGNAESVLRVIAGVVRKAPDQWAMLYPVWPEALSTMPE